MRTRLYAIAILALTVAMGITRADESKVPLGDVPKAGLEAVKTMFPKAEITGAAKETEHDKTVYEVTLKQSGRTIDVTVGTDGKIQLVEKEVAEKELPVEVRRTLDAKYPKATYKIVEQVDVVKDGKPTLDFFETLLVTAAGESLEIQIAPDGKIKAVEKKEASKE
jgi:hypothetical protein